MLEDKFFQIKPYDEKEFNDYEEAKNDFYTKGCFSTKQVLEKIDCDIDNIKAGNTRFQLDADALNDYLKRICEIKKKIEAKELPELKKKSSLWSYNIIYQKNAIIFGLIQQRFFKDKMWHQFGFIEICSSRFEGLTVNEYSKRYNVPETTIRDWIRRGRLRNIEKVNNQWLIPEFEKPQLGKYLDANYQIQEKMRNVPDEVSFIENASFIRITKIKLENKMFTVFIYDSYGYLIEKHIVTEKEKERIERLIIASNSKEVSNTILYATNY